MALVCRRAGPGQCQDLEREDVLKPTASWSVEDTFRLHLRRLSIGATHVFVQSDMHQEASECVRESFTGQGKESRNVSTSAGS